MLHIEDLEARMARFDTQLLAGLEEEQAVLQLLQTIPGIDLIGAAMLLVEIGTNMTAFGSADRLASWVGVCPGNNESAGKRKSGRTGKETHMCVACFVNVPIPPAELHLSFKQNTHHWLSGAAANAPSLLWHTNYCGYVTS